jgi:plastocyanin
MAAASLTGVLCAQDAAAGPVTIDVKAGPSGSAADTVVVFDPLDSMAAPAPPAPAAAVIDQVHKTFTPRVTVVRAGTVVAFPNSDNIHHEVYSFSTPHQFKLSMFANEPHVTQTFDKPGVVLLGCNIHDSMLAFVVVVESPYFLKIPASGRGELNLPAGHYRVRVWNEKLMSSAKTAPLAVTSDAVGLTVSLDQPRESPEQPPE